MRTGLVEVSASERGSIRNQKKKTGKNLVDDGEPSQAGPGGRSRFDELATGRSSALFGPFLLQRRVKTPKLSCLVKQLTREKGTAEERGGKTTAPEGAMIRERERERESYARRLPRLSNQSLLDLFLTPNFTKQILPSKRAFEGACEQVRAWWNNRVNERWEKSRLRTRVNLPLSR